MSIVQHNPTTTRLGGVTGRGFLPGESGNPGGRPKGLSRRVRELVGDDGHAIAEFMFGFLSNEKERTADRMDAATWLADRGFGRAVQALDIDVNRYPALDLDEFSSEDLEALLAIFQRYASDAAELAESGELRLGAGRSGALGDEYSSGRPHS